MLLQDHVAEDPVERHRHSSHAPRKSKAMRAAAVITHSEHEPLPPYFDTTWNGPGTAERHSQLERAACASTRPPPSSFCRKMSRASSLTTFCLHFVGFVFFGVVSVAVGVPAMFWIRAGIQFTPSISRVTVESASIGKSAYGKQSWYLFQQRVSFQKAQTEIRNLESVHVRGCRMKRY